MLSPVIFLSACPLQTSVEGDMSLASKLSHGSLNNSNHQNNKNSNNNHNSKQGSPVRGDSRQAEDVEGEKPEIMLEESRKVVEAFLKRSMSQNAKASFDFMKPEGYHKLKRDGKLAFYQRQQSKPEQGSLVRRESRRVALPSRPSLNELTSEAKKQSLLSKQEELVQFSSARDVRRPGIRDEEGSPIIEKLITADANDSYCQSSDSLPSGSEGVGHMVRRKSFTKATRQSVISYIEGKKRSREVPSSGEASAPLEAKAGNREKNTHHVCPGFSRTPDMTRRYSTKPPRKLSASEPFAVHHVRQDSDQNKDEDVRSSLEKKTSVRERVKKLMAGPSNKKKLQYKKSFEQRSIQVQAEDDAERSALREPESVSVPATATRQASRSSTKEQTDQQGFPSLPRRKTPPAGSRSPSPTKSKLVPKLLHSSSTKPKASPKMKHRTLPTSDLSASVRALGDGRGNLECKSDSLPSSVRLGTGIARLEVSHDRRFSEDVTSSRPAAKKVSPSPSPSRPRNLDLTHKKKPGRKLKRLLQFWKRRHPSTSSTSSESSRSQSLPSLPAAVEQDAAAPGTQHDGVTDTRDDSLFNGVSGHQPNFAEAEKEQVTPYHHRGSLSLSSVDIDRLSSDEKQKIYEEINASLRRICEKYNRYIQSLSTPGSRLATPESSMSSEDYRSFAKATQSDPVVLRRDSSRSSRAPVHSSCGSFRVHTDEGQPAMNAYRNMMHQKQSTRVAGRVLATKMPQPLTRRHTHHTATGSLDSPYSKNNRHRLVRGKRSPDTKKKLEARPDSRPAASEDVVDAGTFVDNVPDGSSSPPAPVRHVHPPVPVRHLHAREPSILSDEEFCPTTEHLLSNGSAVDSQYFYRQRPIFDANGDHPSTSVANLFDATVPREDAPPGEPAEPFDEEKLIEKLVLVLCQKGDDIVKSVDMPPIEMEPVFRTTMTRYMANTTFTHFQGFAHRFCNCVKGLVETSPSRHPEVFPVVMMFNMISAVVEIVSSEATRQVVDNVVDFSSRMLTDFCRGRSLQTFLEDLHETEEELSSVETPVSDQQSSPRRQATDDELD